MVTKLVRDKPGPKPPKVDKEKRRRYVKRLFKKVADRHQAEFPGLKPDMIIAIHAGIDVYGVRQWLTRGVARERIPLMAVLSGEAESDIRRAHGL